MSAWLSPTVNSKMAPAADAEISFRSLSMNLPKPYMYICYVSLVFITLEPWWWRSYPGVFFAEEVEVDLDALSRSKGCRVNCSPSYGIGRHN